MTDHHVQTFQRLDNAQQSKEWPTIRPEAASERRRDARETARGCRAGAPLVMAEETKAADAPPPPPDKEDGEVAEANATPQSTEEGPHPLEHKWTLAAV